jgi:hypothetical protein
MTSVVIFVCADSFRSRKGILGWRVFRRCDTGEDEKTGDARMLVGRKGSDIDRSCEVAGNIISDRSLQCVDHTKANTDPISFQVPHDPEGIIDMEILGQVFEMDELDEEDEDGDGSGHEFSKGIVWNYFEQANTTFDEMKEAL